MTPRPTSAIDAEWQAGPVPIGVTPSSPLVQTKFFGPLPYSRRSVIRFPKGLPGFEEQKEFVFLDLPERAPLTFMQSLRARNLCFVLLPVLLIDPRYRLEITPEQLDELNLPQGLVSRSQAGVLCFAVVSSSVAEIPTANLMAPIVVDQRKRIGVQIVQAASGYSHRHDLLCGEVAAAC